MCVSSGAVFWIRPQSLLAWHGENQVLLLLLLPILCRAASSAALSHIGGFRVGGGVHDSYTFQCGLVGSFTSPGIDTR